MNASWKISFLLIVFASVAHPKDLPVKIIAKQEAETVKVELITESITTTAPRTTAATSTTEATTIEATTENVTIALTSESTTNKVEEISTSTETDHDVSDEDLTDDPDVTPSLIPSPESEKPKRKVIYINQQQNGKLNVHLELSDVSVIVIPNQKDPQLSLLNLLFKSAQKSRLQNEEQKKKENALSDHNDDYSKYKLPVRSSDDVYHHVNMPNVESRVPYKVDISSAMAHQPQPAVEIMPHTLQPQVRSPILQLLKPIQQAASITKSHKIFKRSVDSFLDEEVLTDRENLINQDGEVLTESIFNRLENEGFDDISDDRGDSDFILLGASENCGPGRKRNSYQICVTVE